MTIVNITIKDDDVYNTPMMGVNVAVYNMGAVFQTSGSTDSSGTVSFMLNGSSYRIYMYKDRFSVKQPQTLVIDNTVASNTFEIIGHLKKLPQTLNTDLIRISGYIKQPNGVPKAIQDLKFFHRVTSTQNSEESIYALHPTYSEYPTLNKVVNNDVITNTIVNVKSDPNGYVEFDLYRNTTYEVNMSEGDFVVCQTADIPALELSKLLYPLPVNLTLSANSKTIPLSAGSNTDLSYTCLYSDYIYRSTNNYWGRVNPIYSIPDIASISFSSAGVVHICPLNIGTVTITFNVKFLNNFVWVNPPPFISTTLTVTVV